MTRVKHVETAKEREDAYQVRTIVFVDEQKVPPELEIDEHEEHSEHFVAYDNEGKAVGAGRLRPLNQNEAKVERICVLSSERQSGLGKEIMAVLEDHAKSLEIKRLLLHAQDHAIPFYEKLGYRIISEPFDEAGIMHVKMEKQL